MSPAMPGHFMACTAILCLVLGLALIWLGKTVAKRTTASHTGFN
jgi:hypothetical protein